MGIPSQIQEKWRKDLYIVCVVLATIGTIAEIVIYCIDAASKTLFLPEALYRFRFIYMPSCLNLVVIILTLFCLRSKRLSNTAKNFCSCFLIFFLCMNTQFIHYVYGPLLALPCLAIFLSVLFADKRLTGGISIASCLSILASCYVGSKELRKDDPLLLTDMGLALAIMLVSYIGASLLIRYVAQQIDYILNSSKRENELLEKMQIDNLMGIYNRSKMESVLESLEKSDSKSRKQCLLMIDLDDFKKINDAYGHLSGDQVLMTLADIIRQVEARNVVPCRYGGEEIVIILKDYSVEDAYQLANQLLNNFRTQSYPFAPQVVITFSCGLAAYEEGMSRHEWIRRADENLYHAKRLGKNQVYPKILP